MEASPSTRDGGHGHDDGETASEEKKRGRIAFNNDKNMNNAPATVAAQLEALRVADDTTGGGREHPAPRDDVNGGGGGGDDDDDDDIALPVSSPAPGAAAAAAAAAPHHRAPVDGAGDICDDEDDEYDDAEETMRALKALVDEVAVLPEGELMVTRLRAAKYRLRTARDKSLDDDDHHHQQHRGAATSTATSTSNKTRIPGKKATTTPSNTSTAAAAAADDDAASDEEEDDDELEDPPEESELSRELARSRALVRSSREILDFWTGLARDPSGATRLLHSVLCVALRGHPGLMDSARQLAARYTAAFAGISSTSTTSTSSSTHAGASGGVGGVGSGGNINKRMYSRPLTHEEMHAAGVSHHSHTPSRLQWRL